MAQASGIRADQLEAFATGGRELPAETLHTLVESIFNGLMVLDLQTDTLHGTASAKVATCMSTALPERFKSPKRSPYDFEAPLPVMLVSGDDNTLRVKALLKGHKTGTDWR